MAATALGPRYHSLSQDADGHRTYTTGWLVRCAVTDGLFIAMGAVGLPRVGDPWFFRTDLDPWAFCQWGPTRVLAHEAKEGDPSRYYIVELTHSTRPLGRADSASGGTGGGSNGGGTGSGGGGGNGNAGVQDPLLEPMKISGTFSRKDEEFGYDRFGVPILTSSFEPIRGPEVTWPVTRGTIRIEQNVINLQAPTYYGLADHVNDRALWGFPARCIKFNPGGWEKKYGGRFAVYYTRVLEFEIWTRRDVGTGELFSGWDRDVRDEGTKVLNGHWSRATGAWNLDAVGGQAPDPANPAHFIRATDINGNPMRVILDGVGLPAGVGIGAGTATGTTSAAHAAGTIHAEALKPGNFLAFGIPTLI